MLFSSAFIFMFQWTDVFMLGAMESKAEIGIYNASYKLASIALIVINAVNTVLAPKIAKLYGENNFEGIKYFIKSNEAYYSNHVTTCSIAYYFQQTTLSLFGDEFVAGSNVVIVISLGLYLMLCQGVWVKY